LNLPVEQHWSELRVGLTTRLCGAGVAMGIGTPCLVADAIRLARTQAMSPARRL